MILFARSDKRKLIRRLRELHASLLRRALHRGGDDRRVSRDAGRPASARIPLVSRGPRLHLGCGEHRIGGWINADLVLSGAQDTLLEVRGSLPFRSGSIRFIHSEDLLEHIELQEGIDLLRECYRVLKPGGVMRLLTPDAAAIVKRVYQRAEPRHLAWCRRELSAAEPAEALNMHFRMNGEHRFLCDYPYLKKVLENTGFKVTRVKWNESSHREVRYLDLRDFGLNVFVEAAK